MISSKSIYICNASSIYVLTVTEVFMQFQLDDGLTLRYSAHLLRLFLEQTKPTMIHWQVNS